MAENADLGMREDIQTKRDNLQAEIQAKRDKAVEELAKAREGRQQGYAKDAEERKVAAADLERAKTRKRVDEQVGATADATNITRRGQMQAESEARDGWTPDEQSAVDNQLAIDRAGLIKDPRARTTAGRLTGDITLYQGAQLDETERRGDRAEKKDATLEERARRTEVFKYVELETKERMNDAKVEAAIKRAGGGASGATALSKNIAEAMLNNPGMTWNAAFEKVRTSMAPAESTSVTLVEDARGRKTETRTTTKSPTPVVTPVAINETPAAAPRPPGATRGGINPATGKMEYYNAAGKRVQ